MYARTGIARLLRAPWNFEVDYDTTAGNTPILFTAPYATAIPNAGVADTYTALDPEAQQNPPPSGISPLLARMFPVPVGATLLVTFPIVQLRSQTVPASQNRWAYVWRAIFRMRALADFKRRRKARTPWSIALSRNGTADTRVGWPPQRPTVSVAGSRVVRQALTESVVYNRSLPGFLEQPPFFGTLATDAVKIPFTNGNVTMSPIYPGYALHSGVGVIGALDYEQGERDPSLYTTGAPNGYITGPFHLPKFVKCMGNEMAVECFKYEIDPATNAILGPRAWDFGVSPVTYLPTTTAEDFDFSLLLGIGAKSLGDAPPIDTGVRVIAGAFPQ